MNTGGLKSSGQITMDTEFGKLLSELASSARTIVETGTWNGLGSTLCLLNGMPNDARVFSIEADPEMYRKARYNLRGIPPDNLTLIHGTIVRRHEMPRANTHGEWLTKQYSKEMETLFNAPFVLPHIPSEIDLLLLDGTQFGGDVEFSRLWLRSKCIALDDTHPERGIKHSVSRTILLRSCWGVVADNQNERNGFFAARRPF
jgi:hypothetical protein